MINTSRTASSKCRTTTTLGSVRNNLQLAFGKVDEVKEIAVQNVKRAAMNIEETGKLKVHSENIKLLSMDFEKNAAEMEQIQKSHNFWLFSFGCMRMSGGVICLGAAIFVVLFFFIL